MSDWWARSFQRAAALGLAPETFLRMTPRFFAAWLRGVGDGRTQRIDDDLFVASAVARVSTGWSDAVPFPLSVRPQQPYDAGGAPAEDDDDQD